jgi:hypothetical protein
MKRAWTLFAFGLGLWAILATPNVKADEWDQKTWLTFDEPVTVANFVLQPGQYVFKLADSNADRQIVMIYNNDETHLVAMVQAMPASRLNSGDAKVFFYEAAAGNPRAVRDWFFAGDTSGVEFPAPNVLHH